MGELGGDLGVLAVDVEGHLEPAELAVLVAPQAARNALGPGETCYARNIARPRSSRRYVPRPDLPRLIGDAMNSGSADALLSRLNALREDGDGAASSVLGALYEDGLRASDGRALIRRDRKRARLYQAEAAARGDLSAMTLVAVELYGAASARQRARGVALFRAAARRGFAPAAYTLAIRYLIEGKHRHAVAWFRRAAALDYPAAELQLALAAFHGVGLRRDPEAAIRKVIALAHEPRLSAFEREESLLFVASALRQGWGVKRDLSKSRALVREAAKLGSDAARCLLNDIGPER